MSDPLRFRIADNQVQRVYGGNILVVDPAGPLVEYADYARLKAEVERLRKAGDAMYYNILTYKYHIPDNGNTHFMIDASILGWNPKYGQTTEHGEDKEGKQS